jgi:2-polyprenyl-3-methyl-5-hydroxy-6-metoxy-1,4-benzoquinol methylase
VTETAPASEDFGSFEALKKALESDKWPEAVNPNLICDPNSETDKMERGRGIIELMIEEDLKGLKFLDIGCGEAHSVFLSADHQTALSVGYDVKRHDSWDRFGGTKPNVLLTTDMEEVQRNGPYDVIILFDVLDHIKGEDPIALLKKAAGVLSEKGKVYMRVHPHISRHGTHLYHSINKAYAHLVFTPQEIKQLVPDAKGEESSIGVLYPLKTYNDMIERAGLKVDNRRDITEKVEPFFKIPKIAERIMKNTGMGSFPEFQMSLQFIDYVLKK